MTSYVYKIGFPSGHYYVGVKKGTPEATTGYVGSPVQNRWMWDQFQIVCKEVLWVTETFERALEIEGSILYDLGYKDDPLCLNANNGGKDFHFDRTGTKLPESTKKKIGEKNTARLKEQWQDDGYREKMSESSRRQWEDPDKREVLLDAVKKGAESTKEKYSKPVEIENVKTGETVRFDSVNMASEYIGVARGNISRVALGKRKTVSGFKVRFL